MKPCLNISTYTSAPAWMTWKTQQKGGLKEFKSQNTSKSTDKIVSATNSYIKKTGTRTVSIDMVMCKGEIFIEPTPRQRTVDNY